MKYYNNRLKEGITKKLILILGFLSLQSVLFANYNSDNFVLEDDNCWYGNHSEYYQDAIGVEYLLYSKSCRLDGGGSSIESQIYRLNLSSPLSATLREIASITSDKICDGSQFTGAPHGSLLTPPGNTSDVFYSLQCGNSSTVTQNFLKSYKYDALSGVNAVIPGGTSTVSDQRVYPHTVWWGINGFVQLGLTTGQPSIACTGASHHDRMVVDPTASPAALWIWGSVGWISK